MKNILSKKAQIDGLAPAIIALMIAAVFLVLGLVITQEMRDVDVVTTSESGSATNESAGFNGSITSYTLDALTNFGASVSCSITRIGNGSVGAEITETGNWSHSNCIITNLSSTYVDSDWKITYIYTYGGEAYTSANKTVSGLGSFADFWDIIVIAIVLSIVIGLLLVAFGRQGRR